MHICKKIKIFRESLPQMRAARDGSILPGPRSCGSQPFSSVQSVGLAPPAPPSLSLPRPSAPRIYVISWPRPQIGSQDVRHQMATDSRLSCSPDLAMVKAGELVEQQKAAMEEEANAEAAEDQEEPEDTACSSSSKKKKKVVPGIVYLGHVPPRFRPLHVRNLLSAYGEVGRVFFQAEGKPCVERRGDDAGSRARLIFLAVHE